MTRSITQCQEAAELRGLHTHRAPQAIPGNALRLESGALQLVYSGEDLHLLTLHWISFCQISNTNCLNMEHQGGTFHGNYSSVKQLRQAVHKPESPFL